MEKHLQSATERYEQEESKISPISSMDAEIIVELGEIFGKLDQPELKSAIKQWKSLPDEKIRDILLGWNIEHQKGDASVKEGTSKKKEEKVTLKRKFLDFKGRIFDSYFIRTIEKDFKFNSKEGAAFHCLVFNKDIEGIYHNLVIDFGNEKLRDDAYRELKILLENTGFIEFLN